MLKNNETSEAIVHIEKICSEIRNTTIALYTGFPPIDVVISAKTQKAKDNNIFINTKINMAGELNIDQFDIAMIIANALDNAIESFTTFNQY